MHCTKHRQYIGSSGVISLLGTLDRETTDSYTLGVRVSDGGVGGVNILAADTTFTVTVLEVNEEPPVFTEDGMYILELPENAVTGHVIEVNK